MMKQAEEKYKLSKTAYENARRAIPGGVNSPVRAFREVELSPLFIRKQYRHGTEKAKMAAMPFLTIRLLTAFSCRAEKFTEPYLHLERR
jgi:hypothetical protein